MSDELTRLLDQVHDGITTFDFDGKETPCIVIKAKKYDEMLSKVVGQSFESISSYLDKNVVKHSVLHFP